MKGAFKPVRPFNDFLRLLIAPAIWFAHLVVVYGAEALICTGPTASGSRSMVWIVTGATAAALLGLVVSAVLSRPGFVAAGKPDRSGSKFLQSAALALALLSALGVVWTTLPAALLAACASAGG